MNPATGEEIIAHFRTYDRTQMWARNFSQGKGITLDWAGRVHYPQVPGTTTTIQGVLCCIDRDHTIAWLLMVVDSGVYSYICTTYGGDGKWPWCWIRSKTMLDAVRDFTEWLELNDEDLSRYA